MGHYDEQRERLEEENAERLFRISFRTRQIISFKALREGAVIPAHGTEYSAGFDLSYCPEADTDLTHFVGLLIPPHTIKAIPTGIAVALPSGHHGQVWARSGNATKKSLTTEAGIIDEDYRGEVYAICANRSFEAILIEPGMKIAQLVVVPHYSGFGQRRVHVCEPTVDLPPCGTRGVNGFGSTGQ